MFSYLICATIDASLNVHTCSVQDECEYQELHIDDISTILRLGNTFAVCTEQSVDSQCLESLYTYVHLCVSFFYTRMHARSTFGAMVNCFRQGFCISSSQNWRVPIHILFRLYFVYLFLYLCYCDDNSAIKAHIAF